MDSLDQVKKNIKWMSEKFDEYKDKEDSFTMDILEDLAIEIMKSEHVYSLTRIEYHLVKSIRFYFISRKRREKKKEKEHTPFLYRF